VMRIENLIYDRHKGTFSNLDDSHPGNERDWTKDPHYNLRIFYIGESVRKNWENLQEANFEKGSLPFILLYQAHAERANFSGTDMRGGRIFETHFDNAKMNNVNLRGADLSGADFKSAHLESASFDPPDPKDIPREPRLIDGTQLDHTKLTGANFVEATLNKADFTKADLTGANLTKAHLVDTVMTDAILEGTIVREDELLKTKGKYKGTPKFIK
jgi:uncharacterized protein YjbI with pentapeptide repeats